MQMEERTDFKIWTITAQNKDVKCTPKKKNKPTETTKTTRR